MSQPLQSLQPHTRSIPQLGREILSAIEGAVPPRVKERGQIFADQERVSEPDLVDGVLESVAIGTRIYYVAISFDDGIELSCTCPAFDEGWVCKHIWATALVAARSPEHSDIALFPEPPQWRRFLAGIQDAPLAAAPERARELRYLLDLPASRGEDHVAFRIGQRPAHHRRVLRWIGVPNDDDIARAADPLDRAILGFFTSAQNPYRWWQGARDAGSPCRLPPDEARELLPLLCRSGRFHWMEEDHWGCQPLSWDGGPPWRFEARIEDDDAEDEARLSGRFVRDDAAVALEAALLVVEGGFACFPDRLALFDSEGGWPWVRELRECGTVSVPRSEVGDLYAACLESPGPLPLAVPADLLRDDVAPAPVASFEAQGRNGRVVLELAFRYADRIVASTERRLRLADGDRWIARQPAEEQRAAEALAKLDLALDHQGQHTLREKEFLPAVIRLLDADWEVQAEACRIRPQGCCSVSLTSGQDWFDLEGQADFDGQMAPLPAILEAARNGSRFVKLGDGSLGLLPETWAKQWGLLEALGEAGDDGIRFRANQAWLLDALLAADESVRTDDSFTSLRVRLGDLPAPRPLAAPRSFKGSLRPYQEQGLGWLTYLHRAGFGGCLADDMGLGKTIEVLAHLARLPRDERGPSLLVAPRSLVFNWIAEAERFTPQLRLLDLSGPDRKARMPEIPEHDLALTTYGCLRRDIEALREHRFRYAILDEAQAIKNAQTLGAKAARLLPADHRLALSGTPVENHLGELWSLFEFLNPGMLGRSRAFAAFSQKNGAEVDDRQRSALAHAVRPFVLRRTKAQVLPDLPDRSDSTIPCALSGRQKRDYAAIRDGYRQQILSGPAEDLGRNKIQILEALLRLRQIACHPGLVDPARKHESSAKLEALWPMLDELQQEDHKVLVFSQFTTFLDIIQDRLVQRRVNFERLDGRTRDRARRVEHFQSDPDCRIFLISLKAGGLGLNLTAADYVILMDPWWNPAVESQAIDRAHRFGQTRKVFAYRMVAQGTIEEKILELQKDKRALADQIFTADNALLRDITADDLRFLLT